MLWALCLLATLISNPVDERPNIVLIFTDDQGINDVGCYGSEIPTPHIDRLAKEGVAFQRWYSASSICTPSRYGLLTGRNPSRSQDQLLSALMFMADEHKEMGIQTGETTIAHKLRQGGYDTALFGKWHLGHGSKELLPTRHGFRGRVDRDDRAREALDLLGIRAVPEQDILRVRQLPLFSVTADGPREQAPLPHAQLTLTPGLIEERDDERVGAVTDENF